MNIPIRVRSSKSFSLLLLSFCALTSCYVYPDSGKWEGSVKIWEEGSARTETCPVEIELTRTVDIVMIKSLDLYCGSKSTHWSSDAFTRRGTELFQAGRKVGEIYPDGTVKLELEDPGFHDRYPNPVKRVVITWSRLMDTLHVSVQEDWGWRQRTVEGRLKLTK
jgi:hypothetical protein